MRRLTFTLALVAGAVSTGNAQQASTYKRDLPDPLVRQAKVTEAAAVAVAQKRLPQHTIVALEIERERRAVGSVAAGQPRRGSQRPSVDRG